MEFDADWIWIAIFVGVILVRAVGARLARVARKSQPKMAKVPRQPRPPKQVPPEGFGGPETYRTEETPEPIEPR